MEQLEKFQIIFNNPSAIYNAGDTVYGYGWAVFKEPLHVQSKCQGHSQNIFHSFGDITIAGEGMQN